MKKRAFTAFIAICAVMFTAVFFQSCTTKKSFDEYVKDGSSVEAEICEVKDDRNAIVTVISDDGYYESGVIFNELAKEAEVNVTVAGAVKIISPKLKEWQSIEKEGRVDVVSHSYSHIKVHPEANLTLSQLKHEYVDAKEFYETNFSTPAFTIVAPENSTTAEGFSIWEESGILAARLGTRGENPLSGIKYGSAPGEWLNLRMRGLYDAKTNDQRNAWVDSAINNRTWLIEMWHDISPNGDVHFQPISTENARSLLSYISEKQKEKKVWAASFSQAVSYIYQKDNGKVEAYRLDDSIAVRFVKKRTDLPWDEFNVPLSLKIDVPSDWNDVEIVHGKETLLYERKDGEVVFNVPTDDEITFIKRK